MRRTPLLAVATVMLAARVAAAAAPVPIVAAENFYGDVAHQLAGPNAKVKSILQNPDQDPHLFEASPSVGRELSAARIVVESGADYDPWMQKLLQAAKSSDRQVIVVADLAGKKAGDNPHIWYDPSVIAVYARVLSAVLAQDDPDHRAEYEQRLETFLHSLAPLNQKIAVMRARYAGQPVTATEPVFGYMAAAIGLVMRNERFQLAVMNESEPRASDVAAFEDDLRQHRVRVLLYNSQATDAAAKRLLAIARKSKVPVVGVSETEPPEETWQVWMMSQLDALDQALSVPTQ